MESNLDLNLLVALEALLDERSVGRAAQRLHTSPPAMSRTLARLRRIFEDPVLVRAGHAMVPTPRALAMAGDVREALERARALFAPPEQPNLATLRRTFSVQTGDLLFSMSSLVAQVRAQAPGVTLRFAAESHEDTHSLRDGAVDLELGQIRRTEPETHIEPVLTDRMVGVVRADHELLTKAITPRRFAAADHVVFSRRGQVSGPIDELLAAYGLRRRVVVCAPSPTAALFLVANSDLVGIYAARIGRDAIDRMSLNVSAFEVPLELPPLQISMAWHPRHDADGAHSWLRQQVRDAILA